MGYRGQVPNNPVTGERFVFQRRLTIPPGSCWSSTWWRSRMGALRAGTFTQVSRRALRPSTER